MAKVEAKSGKPSLSLPPANVDYGRRNGLRLRAHALSIRVRRRAPHSAAVPETLTNVPSLLARLLACIPCKCCIPCKPCMVTCHERRIRVLASFKGALPAVVFESKPQAAVHLERQPHSFQQIPLKFGQARLSKETQYQCKRDLV